MVTAIEIHKKVEEKSKSTVKNKLVIDQIAIGKHVRQGDIYVRRIEKVTSKIKLKSKQLAPGNSKGSRHIVENHVKLFHGYSGNEIQEFLKGPQIESDKNFTITHPEHAHVNLPAGSYQVTYQTDFIRKNRVID